MRYLMDTDGDSHWYLIPTPAYTAWVTAKAEGDWRDFSEDGIIPLGCHPNSVTFALPMMFGEPVGDWGDL